MLALEFIRRGADVNKRSGGGLTPLQAAILQVCEVCNRIAKTLIPLPATSLNEVSADGDTAVMLAVKTNSLELCSLLCAQPKLSADIADATGQLPLHLAIRSVHLPEHSKAEDIAITLIRSGRADVNLNDSGGSRPVFLAVEVAGSTSILTALIEAGVRLGYTDAAGLTVLIKAVYIACDTSNSAAENRACILIRGM